jgi:hypothetical protein
MSSGYGGRAALLLLLNPLEMALPCLLGLLCREPIASEFDEEWDLNDKDLESDEVESLLNKDMVVDLFG